MIGDQLGFDLRIFHWLVLGPVEWLLPFFAGLAGGV